MNLSQLRYFRKLASIQHFTKAAEALSITQPALSNSIKQLEEELGISLFEHQGRTVRLTKWGAEFNGFIGQGLDIIDKGIAIAQEHADHLSGTIDIGTIYTVQSDYLPDLLHEYRERYGRLVDIKLYHGLTRDLLDRLEDGAYDVCFAARMEGRPNLAYVPVVMQSLVVIVNEAHPLASRDKIALEELSEFDVVTYRDDNTIGREVRALIKNHDIDIVQSCDDEISLGSTMASREDCVGLALDTLGLAPFPQIKKIQIEGLERGFHLVYMAYRRAGHKTRAVENIIELARENAKRDGFLL